ncbi:hypothetical protein K466DRAFT_86334 [Polyporus arcularius HHB13444]|uniref:Secreted protein n=1 Tax=Polyporus arcularius HHB13444 TaxID=1314778 RepID=A0A5C3PH04_9APHY|nr:hypothetical protein K466DRAFT_86334 [Polyporus arcularius HHB13444]
MFPNFRTCSAGLISLQLLFSSLIAASSHPAARRAPMRAVEYWRDHRDMTRRALQISTNGRVPRYASYNSCSSTIFIYSLRHGSLPRSSACAKWSLVVGCGMCSIYVGCECILESRWWCSSLGAY